MRMRMTVIKLTSRSFSHVTSMETSSDASSYMLFEIRHEFDKEQKQVNAIAPANPAIHLLHMC